jgi:hypothetical protein
MRSFVVMHRPYFKLKAPTATGKAALPRFLVSRI